MNGVWDYNPEELKKSESGRILLLERMINFGPDKGTKIKLAEVKKYWDKLNLFTLQKRLFSLLLWGTYNFPQESKKSYWMK